MSHPINIFTITIYKPSQLFRLRSKIERAIVTAPEFSKSPLLLEHIYQVNLNGVLNLNSVNNNIHVREMHHHIHDKIEEFLPNLNAFYYQQGPITLRKAVNPYNIKRKMATTFLKTHAYSREYASDYQGWLNLSLHSPKVFTYIKDCYNNDNKWNDNITHELSDVEELIIEPGSAVIYPANLFCSFNRCQVHYTNPELLAFFGLCKYPYKQIQNVINNRLIPTIPPHTEKDWQDGPAFGKEHILLKTEPVTEWNEEVYPKVTSKDLKIALKM